MDIEDKKKQRLEKIVNLLSDSEIASIKNVVTSILHIISDPASNAGTLKKVIEVDPPLSAKVLKTANSAYYYSRRHISDISEAVIWIGFEALKEIALHQKVCEVFQGERGIEGFSRKNLWKHSVAVALLGKMIYRMEFGKSGENIYAAGLLHDIGMIAEEQFFRHEFTYILKKVKKDKKPVHVEENDLWGYDHADIGMAISEAWQFP